MEGDNSLNLCVSRASAEDIPDIAEGELVAFMPNIGYTAVLRPNLASLQKSGIPIRQWPDYYEKLERFQRDFVSHNLQFKVTREEDGKFLGFASMSIPGKREDRTWIDWIWGDCIYPSMRWLGLAETYSSLNKKFLRAIISESMPNRRRLMNGREYAFM